MEYASSQQYEEVLIKNEKMEMNLKRANLALFIAKILFFVWIMMARYSHTGKVCSGDFNGYEVVKEGSNFDSAFSYTYLGFPGWVMKLYVWIFMIVLIIRGTIALYLDTDWDPEDPDNNADYDDNYGRLSGTVSTGYDYQNNHRQSFGGTKWDERNHRGMFDSPDTSPHRKSFGNTSPGKL